MSAGGPSRHSGGWLVLLSNDRGQHAVWPVRLPVPAGWSRTGEPRASAADCAAALDAAHTETWSLYTHRSRSGPHSARTDGPWAPTVTQLVRQQVERTPQAWAVLCDDERIDYAELGRRIGRLARQLRRHGGVAQSLVAVCLDRTADLAIGLLAVLQAGGAVLPLDPATPARRLVQLVRDADSPTVLTNRAHRRLFADADADADEGGAGAAVRVLTVEDLAAEPTGEPSAGADPVPAWEFEAPHPEDPAYMIYTSGSTGPPKGVVTSNRSLALALRAAAEFYRLGPGDRVAHLAALAFDTSLEQILAPLITGAAVVLTGRRSWAPTDLLHRIARERITVADLTPAYWRGLISVAGPAPDHLAPLRLVIVGGEVIHADHCRAWLRRFPGVTLVNAYGLTEATITSTACELTQELLGGADGAPAPVGRALAGALVHVLDADLRPVPPGERGEVYIGGTRLAEAVWKQPGLTARQFLPDPHATVPGSRMYRTGDLGRRRADGSLEILGRIDEQLKIRGFRIDPAEVEAVLNAQQGVGLAAVVARDRGDGEPELVAFYSVGADGSAQPPDTAGRPAELRSALAAVLPAHMVPVELIPVGQLPLTPNGKIDRADLPDRAASVHTPREARPQPPFTSGMAQLWSLILGVERISADDDFFDRGGNSLLAMEMLARARVMFGIGVGQIRELTRSLLHDSTLSAFARSAYSARAGTLIDADGGAVDFASESELGVTVRRAEGARPPDWRRPADVLLTGATGYCGIHLLDDLLQHTRARIHCVVRAADADRARERISASARRYLLRDLPGERIHPIVGDLGEPRLGLSVDDFERLGSMLDAVYHFGAQVNFIYPYDQLRAVNVGATRELIRLAAPRSVPLHFASTMAVLAGFGAAGVREVSETTALDFADYLSVGYVETKWVSEALLQQASRAGLPVAVYRFQDITGTGPAGVLNTSTEICALMKYIADSGLCPKVELPLDFLPADVCARAVGHISANHRARGAVYHLTNPHPAGIATLADSLRRSRYQVQEIPYAEWVPQLIRFAAGHPTHPVTPFVPLFVDRCRHADMSVSEMYFQDVFPRFSRENTESALAGSGIVIPPVDARMLDGYVAHLRSIGYLTPAQSPADGA
jgi:amino acid adenylation domain-containing protein/thioester reductase-like protein